MSRPHGNDIKVMVHWLCKVHCIRQPNKINLFVLQLRD